MTACFKFIQLLLLSSEYIYIFLHGKNKEQMMSLFNIAKNNNLLTSTADTVINDLNFAIYFEFH